MHILFHRSTPWHGDIRCSTNIFAELFAKAGHDVTYVERLLHTGHLMKKCERRAKYLSSPKMENGAWRVSPASLIPFMASGPFGHSFVPELAYRTTFPSLYKQVMQRGSGEPDVIWTATPGSSVLKHVFPRAKLVFQVVDFYAGFENAGSDRRIAALEQRDYNRADHIFSIGHQLKQHLCSNYSVPEDKVTVLGQGVFHERFEKARELPAPPTIAKLPHPRAVWVGWMDKIDPQLFAAARDAVRQLGGSMVLIGAENEWSREFSAGGTAGDPPIAALGQLPPEEVAKILVHCDIGLMLYDQSKKEIYRGQNPLKLYEYAAAGLPTVSTPHDEFEHLRPPIKVVSDEESTREAMDRICKTRHASTKSMGVFSKRFSWQNVFTLANMTLTSGKI